MRRLFVMSVLLSILATLIVAQPAGATLWCKADPVVRLNGRLVDITIAIPVEYVPLVNGPVDYEIQTPNGTTRQVVVSDPVGFGKGTVIRFTNGGGAVKQGVFSTTVRVIVPIDQSKLGPGQTVATELTVLSRDDNGVALAIVVTTGTSTMTTATLEITGTQQP